MGTQRKFNSITTTASPWVADQGNIIGPEGNVLGTYLPTPWKTEEANGRLMAAAPELLKNLINMKALLGASALLLTLDLKISAPPQDLNDHLQMIKKQMEEEAAKIGRRLDELGLYDNLGNS
ncbi:MAG: hypothetical protein MUO40_03285 [Anaerolineaceae bacterium]|nr:hypothetical protein [Anaerolineaceae bacterium]